jgi:hypothetical protein
MMANIVHNHADLDEMVKEIVELAKAGKAQGVTVARAQLSEFRKRLKAHGFDVEVAKETEGGPGVVAGSVIKALGDPPAKGSTYDGGDRCTEADKFSTECFADPIVLSKLSKSDREFVDKALVALGDPGVSQHAKDMTKGQLEQLARQCNNGGAVVPDFDALPQIGSTGSLKKSVHLSPRQLTERLDVALKSASPAGLRLLAMVRPQIEELDEKVGKSAVNISRVAKSEPLLYDASLAKTAAMIAATIENITRTSATITDPSGSTSPGVSGAAGNVGSVHVGPSVGGVSGVAGIRRTSTTGSAAVELEKAEKALADAPDAQKQQIAGEAVTYWKLVKMRGG